MTASAVLDSVLSNITLSLLEDTGWYTVDYSKAEQLMYGMGAGCPFVQSKCIESGVSLYPWYFTTNFNENGCYFDFTKKGVSTVSSSGNIPSEFNYFNTPVTALDPFGDNCPSYVMYEHGDCRVALDHVAFGLVDENYGVDSRCFMGTFVKESNASFYNSGYTNNACFKTTVILLGCLVFK